ncbi:DUF4282 domain-containing protein [Nesterenkonia jeotgali]|uniref:Uncharacterized membrane protein (DUF485 family) n=1 Tax=Nesterenkonia jeotgali TaxID=317018 RepID=A0A0W8IIS6_9MICC|nr:DUF4282 domain-containing protein [Nesterenkonia jeotgali]KUG59818.1 hypothetical protein AVL63_12190 [Nesterenkonia jeotgali]MBA8921838.1 uncharacterized membrane protein (DUF485 family) [Nesterenkonia jeotgali]
MTQHPGQNEPSEGENPEKAHSPEKGTDSPGHQPTTPLGDRPGDAGGPGRPAAPGPAQAGRQPQQPDHPGQSTPAGEPGPGPYGRPTSPQQAPGAGAGAGYGQPRGGYPGPGQSGPGQSGPGQSGRPQSGQDQPGQPRPGQSGQYPGQPGQYPGQPGQYPGQPGQHPAQPSQYPGQPGLTGQYPGPSYQQQPYPQPPQSQRPGAPSKNAVEGKNFFAALFDLSFQSFVTVKFAKFIYVLLIAFVVLGYLVVVASAFTEGPGVGLLALLFGWIPAAFYVILIRITLEFMIALVRTSQNTAGTRSEIEALRSELKDRG